MSSGDFGLHDRHEAANPRVAVILTTHSNSLVDENSLEINFLALHRMYCTFSLQILHLLGYLVVDLSVLRSQFLLPPEALFPISISRNTEMRMKRSSFVMEV